MIGTDHGMTPVGPLVNIARILSKHDIKARDAGDGATLFLYLEPGQDLARAKRALSSYPHAFSVYTPDALPAFMCLGQSKRLGDLVLHARPPYWVAGTASLPWYSDLLGISWLWSETFTPDFGGIVASHGYDPAQPYMHGIFYAWEAGVAKGHEIKRLDIVDVHPTVMSLLGLQPGQPVDGKIVSEMLVPAAGR